MRKPSRGYLTERLRALSVAAFALVPTLLGFAALHFALVCVLSRIKYVHWPLAANGTLHDEGQVSPDRWRHRDEDARIVQVLFICWPANTLLVALLCTGALLERQSGEEQKKTGQKNEADAAGVQCSVGAAV